MCPVIQCNASSPILARDFVYGGSLGSPGRCFGIQNVRTPPTASMASSQIAVGRRHLQYNMLELQRHRPAQGGKKMMSIEALSDARTVWPRTVSS